MQAEGKTPNEDVDAIAARAVSEAVRPVVVLSRTSSICLQGIVAEQGSADIRMRGSSGRRSCRACSGTNFYARLREAVVPLLPVVPAHESQLKVYVLG